MRASFIDELLKIATKDKKIVLLTGDLGFGVLNEYCQKLPDQFLNCGIAEANMLSFAGGMSKGGFVPVVYSIGNFPTIRAMEQIRNDVCYPNNNVKIICIGGGYTYGTLGMSHHALEDIAMLRALPNMHIFTPSNKAESKFITEYMFKIQGPCYLRLERDSNPAINTNLSSYEIGSPLCYSKTNKKICIFCYGSIFEEVVSLENIADIYTTPILKPINENAFKKVLENYDKVIVVEEHSIIGGLGDIIATIIATNGLITELIKCGINDTYLSKVGSQSLLRKYSNIDKESIKRIIEKL